MKCILCLVLVILCSTSSYGKSSSHEIINQISLKENFHHNCLFIGIENDIDSALKRSKSYTSNEYVQLLYAKYTQHLCNGENSEADSILDKLSILSKEKISNDYYIAIQLELGWDEIVANKGGHCNYFRLANKRVDKSTHFILKIKLKSSMIAKCGNNDPVVVLRELYKVLEEVNQDNYLFLKADVLRSIASEYVDIGQSSLAAKLGEEAIAIDEKPILEIENLPLYYNLARDFLDAGDIINAQRNQHVVEALWRKNKSNLHATRLKLALSAIFAYTNRDYKLLMDIMDEMSPFLSMHEKEYNTNLMNILQVIACFENGRSRCVATFMSNIEQHLEHPKDGMNMWFLRFLVNYHIEVGASDKAKHFFELYSAKSSKIQSAQQNSARVLGVAQLHQDIVEMDLNLAKKELKIKEMTIYLSVLVTFISFICIGILWRFKNKQKYFAETDSLTNISNRRSILSKIACKKRPAANKIHAAVMFDLDKFKNINDTYGHDVGDKALKHIVQLVKNNIRSNDEFGRIGGEEFLIYLDNMPPELARTIIERIRQSFEVTHLKLEDGKSLSITASFSLAILDDITEPFESIYQRLDVGLYAAKDAGRNTIFEVGS